MLSLGALSFAAPVALAAFALLPALWWLLRVTPPSPRRIVFPPLRLLRELAARDETTARTPWWLLLMRLALASCLILGVARPLLNAAAALPGSGPVYLVIDNGWAAGEAWRERLGEASRVIDRADRENRSVVLIPTAPAAAEGERFAPPALLPAARARELVQALAPQPWPADRAAASEALLQAANAGGWPPGAVIWISDGMAEPAGREPPQALVERLRRLGPPTVLLPKPHQLPLLIAPGKGADGLEPTVARATADGARAVKLRLISDDGAVLDVRDGRFGDGERSVRLPLGLPTEMAGQLARIEVEGAATAGGVLLVDERWQRRAVGLLGEGDKREQPLLGGHYYLQRALQPFAEVREGDLATLLARPLDALILTDVGTADAATTAAIKSWVEKGGVLLRFAGPRLARETQADDPLLPVALRAGDRAMGGALSWTRAGKLAAFDDASPFHGLAVPGDLEIHRQVIAEPSLDVAERTWARLEDGTPLITAARRGDGWVVLVHTTAEPDWSNLPLSGLFVDLLHRIVALGTGGGGGRTGAGNLAPVETLDGFGRLQPPPAGTRAIDGSQAAQTSVGPGVPPGYYGTPDARFALNLAPSVGEPRALPPLPVEIRSAVIGESGERDLRPWFLGMAAMLALADLAVSLALRGMLPRLRPAAAAAGVVLLLAVAGSGPSAVPAAAESVIADGTAAPAALSTSLAFIRTGDPRLDQISAAGLAGLSAVINRRTAAELGEPVGVDAETDEIAFYPVLYWPVAEPLRPVSPQAARRLTDYMRNGGTIVFDTRGEDGGDRSGLRELARVLDLPPLVPVTEDHVLRRSYYLLSDLPGRRAGGTVWTENLGEHVNDGVSSVIAGSGDWAAAWATDAAQRPLFAVTPGGERQREHAYRFGVNLVMYVLTGNYKADQVHTSTILERLGP